MNMFRCFGKARLARISKIHLTRPDGTRPARFHYHAALLAGLLLLGTNFSALANDIQDANKLFKQGQHGQALDKVNGILAGKPKDAQARFLKGLILTEQGQTGDAIKTFSALTEDYPELPEPYNNLAVLYASQGQYDKAKLALEMAIRTHPSYATAHENLGDIYAKMASQAYDRALQLDRSNTATQTKLAMIQDLFAGNTRGKTATTQAPLAPNKTEAPPPVSAKTTVAANAPEAPSPEPVIAEPASETKPQPAQPAVANSSTEVMETVKAWAAAWSAQDVSKYLSFYAADFKTPGSETRTAWEATRKERVSQPKFIKVGISKATVKFADNSHATVKFHQSYQASHMKASGTKTLQMVNAGDGWQIQEEISR